MNKKAFAFFFLGALSASFARPVFAVVEMSSWISYQTQHEELVDIDGRQFTSVCVFAYDFDTDDNIRAARPWVDSTLNYLMENKSPGRPVFITIVNDIESNPPQQHNGALVLRILSDPVKRANHIQQIVALSEKADGIDIDYEALLTGTRPHFSQFIQELRAALPPSKLLSVVCQPKTNNNDGPRGNAIDWVAIHPHVDIMKIMTYYYSFSASTPGASAPLDKVQAVTHLAVSQIPAEKLHIVLTQFGWNWPDGGIGEFLGYDEAMAIAAARGVTAFRDPASQYLRINYDDNGTPHQIWFPDRTSLFAQMDVIQNAGVNKIDIWQMGVGDSAYWDWVRTNTVNPDFQNPVPDLLTMSPNRSARGEEQFTLTVDGRKFVPDSLVRWNGQARPTTFVRANRLTARISASDVEELGVSTITVFNASPGGGSSAPLFFTVQPFVTAPTLTGARAYPNPWMAGRHAGASITFDRLTPNSSVKIFTISSRWIKTLPADQGAAVWDLTNEDREPVASGYYIYLITDSNGAEKKGKVAVVR